MKGTLGLDSRTVALPHLHTASEIKTPLSLLAKKDPVQFTYNTALPQANA